MRPLLLIAALLVLAACTTLSEEECRAGDWFQIGVSDGAEGRGTDRIEAHRRACAPAGIAPDVEAWLRGRERGLRLYCVPPKAYEAGRRGRAIAEGCTAAELTRMRPAWEWGRQYWRLELEADSLRSDIRDITSDLASLPADGAGRGSLLARRSMLITQLRMVEARQRRFATWP